MNSAVTALPPIPVLLSWSGGKDAAWALHTLRQQGGVEVVGLLTTLTEGFERVSMQGIRRDVLHAQAQVAGLPLIEAWIPHSADNASYVASFSDALTRARQRWSGLAHIAYGDLLLADIRHWRETLCASLGWTPLFPLFGADTAKLARAMLAGGLRAQLCCVDTSQLHVRFAGRDFDANLLDELPVAIDPCGENGEFHTCISAGPMFSRPIDVIRGDTLLRDGRFAYTDFSLP